jgi:hypothetical protein
VFILLKVTITITLRNSGNPVAAEPYTFYIALDVNQCNSAPLQIAIQ